MVKAACLFDFNQPLKVDSFTLKPPREDEVVVKVAASGVCHTDLSVTQGKIPQPPPCILGHEGAGVVVEVGKGVRHLKPGDHVVMSWVRNCGRCVYCARGKSHLCEEAIRSAMAGEEMVFEYRGMPVGHLVGVGSFADHTVVRATAAIKIRDDMPLDRACLLGCAVMTGVGAVINSAQVRPGDTVAVFGCGGVGLNVIQGAALAGAARIIAVDLFDAKLEMARAFGATDVVNGKNADAADAVRELTGGLGVDYAFEVIGQPAAVVQAFQSLQRGGKVIAVGVPGMGQEYAVHGFSVVLEEKSIIGSLYGSANLRRDLAMLIELYMNKKLKIDELISRRIGIDDVNGAFDAMQNGEVARSVITF
ncbi:MAG: Zn-dependent alcohol dehydrogenase [Candidatus Binatia bacterium]